MVYPTSSNTSLSSGISGTLKVCETAAAELRPKYPDRKIICIDSLRYSAAAALLIIKASEKRAAGASIEETAEYANPDNNISGVTVKGDNYTQLAYIRWGLSTTCFSV